MNKKGETKISSLIMGTLLFSIMIVGLTSVWGDFGTQYGVSTKTMDELDQATAIEDLTKDANIKLAEEEPTVWESILSTGTTAVNVLKVFPETINTMLTAGIGYLGLPAWVSTLIWISVGLVFTVGLIYAAIGRPI